MTRDGTTRTDAATGHDPVLRALRATGSPIRRVRYRANRTVLLSVSRDGRTLNCHECFRHAPPEIAGAVATYVTARRGSLSAREALDRLRGWGGTREGLAAARRRARRRKRARADSDGRIAALRRLFDRLNRRRFHGALPAIPLRVSTRMTRSLGTIRYGRRRGEVEEIAIAEDLLLPPNLNALEDTLLHEMAHAEAWLRHGHRGHGPVWRRIAERVGCTPRALTRAPIIRGRDHGNGASGGGSGGGGDRTAR